MTASVTDDGRCACGDGTPRGEHGCDEVQLPLAGLLQKSGGTTTSPRCRRRITRRAPSPRTAIAVSPAPGGTRTRDSRRSPIIRTTSGSPTRARRDRLGHRTLSGEHRVGRRDGRGLRAAEHARRAVSALAMRASMVRDYLITKFHPDPQATGAMALSADSPDSPENARWNGVVSRSPSRRRTSSHASNAHERPYLAKTRCAV